MSSTTSEHPDRVGPYHLLQVIGEGGMGVVYEAEQREPVRRRVALKMVKVGMDTKEVIGRFEAERQALAVMDHPGIARVLDAGASDEGRPYFVMELVRGIRIDEYCDHHRLALSQRVELAVEICEAVQHAHQKGVVHRDLKPSNVLVTEAEGHARPKIIDFGVAKAVAQRLTQETFVTTYGQAIGTLAYMSPEQAEMSGLDIDTRSDIYSLGILLHELAVGVVPLDPQQVGAPTFLASLIQRDQTMPTLASSWVHMPGERRDTVAELRGSDRAGLERRLRGDLQWIVQKAIEKDRARRYETASALAADLRHYLSDEPIAARPPTARYRLRKFVRRNRAGTLGAGAAAAALVAGTVVATAGMLRAREAERAAVSEALAAAQVSDFLVEMFELGDPRTTNGEVVTARQILDRGAERILGALETEPVVRARLLHTLGRIRFRLSLDDGRDYLEEALELRRARLGPDHPDVAETLVELARAHRTLGDFDQAEAELYDALRIREATLGASTPEVGQVLGEQGMIAAARGRLDEADSLFLAALPMLEGAYGRSDERVLLALTRIASLDFDRGDYDEAQPQLEEIMALEVASGREKGSTYAMAASNLGAIHHVRGRLDQAEGLYREAIDTRERLLGPEHGGLATPLTNLGELSLALGRPDEAERLLVRSLQIRENVNGPSHPGLLFTLITLGQVHVEQRRFADAEQTLRRAIGVGQGLPPEHPDLVAARATLADVLERTGRREEAERLRTIGTRPSGDP